MGPTEIVKLDEKAKGWHVHFLEVPCNFSPTVQFNVYLLKTGTSLKQFSFVTGKFNWTNTFFITIPIFLAGNVGYDLRKAEGGLVKKIKQNYDIRRMTKVDFSVRTSMFL